MIEKTKKYKASKALFRNDWYTPIIKVRMAIMSQAFSINFMTLIIFNVDDASWFNDSIFREILIRF